MEKMLKWDYGDNVVYKYKKILNIIIERSLWFVNYRFLILLYKSKKKSFFK